MPDLERGRQVFAERAWGDAYEALGRADRTAPLPVEDIERCAVAAYLIGRDADHAALMERAHLTHRDRGDTAAAARCAFWIGLMQLFRGEAGHASGWLSRAERLLGERDCVEQGYLLLPTAERQLRQGDTGATIATVTRAIAIGERFVDRDLVACARHLQGRALMQQGDVDGGLILLDEVMVAVTTGDLSPVMTGLLYCSVIEACQRAYALDRATEWTGALSRWCDEQRGLVAFSAVCLARRSEIMQMRGEWPEALREAQRACDRVGSLPDRRPPPAALYQRAEVHRLRGRFDEAETGYGDASASGRDPQPGLALLRLAQGRLGQAAQAIRRAVAAASHPLDRSRLLPAQVEIMLAAGDPESAHQAVEDLEEIAATFGRPVLRAMAAEARGRVQLASGDHASAVGPLREAWQLWTEADAPWLAARTRVLIGHACRALGDVEGAALEFRAARDAFERMGAAPDLAQLDALSVAAAATAAHPLSARELEVIRLVAAGGTNRAIAGQLAISEKTVARHLSNIFGKLGLSTRAAAAAWAWRHGLA
jgi:ATP/maltotriose-dependent transcriptional regulator MalT